MGDNALTGARRRPATRKRAAATWQWALVHNVVMVKDVRVRMRSRNTVVGMTLYLAVLGAAVIIFLVQHSDSGARASHAGVRLFQILAVAQVCLSLIAVPVSTAGAISGERYRQTWDLLVVTGLSSFEIVWGKLLANLIFNLLLVVAPIPFFAAVFLFGGVTLRDVARFYIVLFVTVLLLTVMCLFVSAVAQRPTPALVVSGIASLLLGFGLTFAAMALESWPQISGTTDFGSLVALSPGAPPLTPLAQVDPLLALLSALPSGGGETVLGSAGLVHHAFGLPLNLPLWGAFSVLALAVMIVLVALSTLLISPRGPRPRREAW